MCALSSTRSRPPNSTCVTTNNEKAGPQQRKSFMRNMISSKKFAFGLTSLHNSGQRQGVTVAFGQRRPSMMSTLVNITRPANGGLPANGSPASPVKRTADKSCANRSVELVQLIQVALESPRHQVLLTPEHVHATSTSTPSLDVV